MRNKRKTVAIAAMLVLLSVLAVLTVTRKTMTTDIQIIRPYISGIETVGTTLTGNYTYYDPTGNYCEFRTTFRWLRSDEKLGEYEEISGAKTRKYTLTADDAGKYIRFEVTPKSGFAVGETGTSWMIGPVLMQEQYASVFNYFDNDNDYITNVGVIQNELKLRLKNALYFTVDTYSTEWETTLTGSEYIYDNNVKKPFSGETRPISIDNVVYAPKNFFFEFLCAEPPLGITTKTVDNIEYYSLREATEKLGKQYWDGNEIQSDISNFQMTHLGQGLVVISDIKEVFRPTIDRDLINEACNMLYALRATEEQMQWFRDAKYGMFIHWDPSCMREIEISWQRKAFRPADIDSTTTEPIDKIYDTEYKKFNPTDYNPREWMKIAKASGMKYVVLTTKHHGGFSNFTSNYDNYTIEHAPYEGDIVKEYVDAAREAGLKIGFYYSARDWYNPNYLTEDHHRYLEYYFGQVQELLTRYGKIDIMWFDSIGKTEEVREREWNKWDPRTLLRRMKQLQPDLIINNRYTSILGKYEISPYDINGDWYTPEHRLGEFDSTRPWESCMSLAPAPWGGWSWCGDDASLNDMKTSVTYLINAVVNDGNLLYGIGPKADGTLDAAQTRVLLDVGAWLEPYEEAFYKTRGGPYQDQQWGGSTYRVNEDGTETIYLHITPLLYDYVSPDNTLYIDFPSNGQQYNKAELLINGKNVDLVEQEEGYCLTLPDGETWDEFDTVIKMYFSTDND